MLQVKIEYSVHVYGMGLVVSLAIPYTYGLEKDNLVFCFAFWFFPNLKSELQFQLLRVQGVCRKRNYELLSFSVALGQLHSV